MRPIGLVACSKSKLAHPASARELYTGALFRKSVAWLESRVDRWAILSAKHGVVDPGDVLEPYDETLVGARADVVRHWQFRVGAALRYRFPGRDFLVIAGAPYLGALRGLPYSEAFGGLPIGRKLQVLTRAIDLPRLEWDL